MANTTFTGPVRSEGGFTSISKNTATGTISTLSSISSPGVASFDANTLATEAGWIITTTIMIDLTGLRATASGDIIGGDGTSNPCHIGQITAAQNGTIIAGCMECFEAPTTGDPDINVHSATEGTGTEDSAISGLTETLLVNAGDATLGSKVFFTAFPAADEFLYLTLGATTEGTYDAGKLVITLIGTA